MALLSTAVHLDCEPASENLGDALIVRCKEFEGIWSPREIGSFGLMCEEHRKSHRAAEVARDRANEIRYARRVYRNTEPGDPARRGLNAYADWLG